MRAIFAGLAFPLGLVLVFHFSIKRPPSDPIPAVANAANTANTTVVKKQGEFGLPVRLKIPGINVDSAVESVGLTTDGAMDTPKDQDDVAWFNLGERPGENGSAVITGHSGVWKSGEETVFNNLYKLHKDDKLYVEDEKGGITTFVVREFRTYDPNADASDVFNSDDEGSHLNLITCEGVWNKDSKSYSGRLVVFADKE